ncbi:hypothetical protein K9B32_12215 [Rhizobium sp. 3T7]|uniref:hypothetical protein n=1 Tax=Rhizobium sp. 3T7 TaxID=2874922 RepID=UPI001CCD0ABB|nr:hypothetical protein [Rhizobium sp. 3T7]MBZ9790883.1 hypothetical protein [Rhizobium sp. 3T7]
MDKNLAAFIESPVMQIIGTSGLSLKPEIGRGAGAWCDDLKTVHVVVSAWQWPQTVANLRDNAQVAVTFARPTDYVSYQIKGMATVREAVAAEIERSSRYMVAIVSTLMRLGLMPEMITPWLSKREAMLVSIEPSSIFVQTPGPTAGTRIWNAAQ